MRNPAPRQNAKYLIADIPFRTKRDIAKYVCSIVESYADDTPLTHDDFVFMRSLLNGHPDMLIKVGCGVADMFIRVAPIYGGNTRCFWLSRSDGSSTDFSWRECIYPTPLKQRVKRAFRNAVDDQVYSFKRLYFDNTDDPQCALSDERIEFVGSHVDHIPPDDFDDLTKRFLFDERLRFDQVVVISTEDGQFGDSLADEDLSRRWQEYHREHAHLRVVSGKANLSLIPELSVVGL